MLTIKKKPVGLPTGFYFNFFSSYASDSVVAAAHIAKQKAILLITSAIIGTGVKGFRYLCRNKIYILEKDDGCSTHPHNTYVQILVSTGLIGFIILLIAFGFIIKAIFNCRSEMRKTNIFDPYLASQGIMISTIFVNLWPIVPSGNFFNNWVSMIITWEIRGFS